MYALLQYYCIKENISVLSPLWLQIISPNEPIFPLPLLLPILALIYWLLPIFFVIICNMLLLLLHHAFPAFVPCSVDVSMFPKYTVEFSSE
jgi:hypothetical protein